MRGTLKPFVHATSPARALRVSGLYVGDHYLADHDKSRAIADVFWEQHYVAGAFEYLTRTDRQAGTALATTGHGWAIWTTPRTGTGWELLVRYERFTPDERVPDATRTHGVYGVTYWFPQQHHGSTALMLDYERVVYGHFVPAQPTIGRVALHALVDF